MIKKRTIFDIASWGHPKPEPPKLPPEADSKNDTPQEASVEQPQEDTPGEVETSLPLSGDPTPPPIEVKLQAPKGYILFPEPPDTDDTDSYEIGEDNTETEKT